LREREEKRSENEGAWTGGWRRIGLNSNLGSLASLLDLLENFLLLVFFGIKRERVYIYKVEQSALGSTAHNCYFSPLLSPAKTLTNYVHKIRRAPREKLLSQGNPTQVTLTSERVSDSTVTFWVSRETSKDLTPAKMIGIIRRFDRLVTPSFSARR
jgi:hypothetical protein